MKNLLVNYLNKLNTELHDPFRTTIWEAELETMLLEETSIGKNQNRFSQFKDIHRIRRFIRERFIQDNEGA